ncbi:MAG: competence/damage-inducible protein A [Rikenellaceae bacterium]
MKTTIITIGDEILIGQIVDTNAVYISQQLNSIGCVVGSRYTIGDGRDQIKDTINSALEHNDVVIMTGGLGPTKDDITKHTLSELFNSPLVQNEIVAKHVEQLVSARGLNYNVLNQAQSLVPACCEVLFNAHGTAPGMWFNCQDNKVLISLPGVPFEMKHLIEDQVLPRLKERYTLRSIVHRTMITAGLPESQLALKIEEWEDALPSNVKLAYLPSPGRVRLRLSAYEVEQKEAEELIAKLFTQLETIIPEGVVGYQDASLEEVVHNRLIEKSLTLSIAESCTGGAIASKFTALAGASSYLLADVVAYSNEAKAKILGVDKALIEQYGAVSEEVAIAMAEGIQRRTNSDIAISTTGIAGPSGGSKEKPIGTVWFGVVTKDKSFAIIKDCGTDRGQIIGRATYDAITLLKNNI